MHSFLADAELRREQGATGFVEPPGLQWRRREITPKEQLLDEHEEMFVASEELAEIKADEEDKIWTDT